MCHSPIEPVYTGARFPVMSNSSSIPSTALMSIVPSALLMPLNRTYQYIGSSSIQWNSLVLTSVQIGAASFPARSAMGVRVVFPLETR